MSDQARDQANDQTDDRVMTCRVEIHLSRTPPVAGLTRAAGVSDVAVSGTVLTCLVSGSFQPLLECLLGYEVLRLWSSPTTTQR